MERWGNNKAIFMHKVTNDEYLENISSLLVVKNNDNYNLRNNNITIELMFAGINMFLARHSDSF